MSLSHFQILFLSAVGIASQTVVLTDPQAPDPTRTPVAATTVVVYDVRDVVEKLDPIDLMRADLDKKLARFMRNQEQAARAGESTDPKGDQAARREIETEHRLTATRDLAELAQRFMQPAVAQGREQLTVPSEGVLVCNLQAEQHAWLSSFLELQRSATGVLEHTISVFEAPRGAFRDAGLVEAATAFEDAAALDTVRARLAADERIVAVSSPRLAVLNGQKGSLSVLNQVAYVKDWTVTIVEPGPQEIADPTIDIIQEGFTANVRSTRLAADQWGVDLGFEVSKLERPIPTRKIRVSASTDREVEIGLPDVTRIHFKTKLVLSDGASAAFTTSSPDRDKDMAIVLTLKHRAL